MPINVKPLTHWVIYKGYKVRFHQRTATAVTGKLMTPIGEIDFTYNPIALVVELPHEQIVINEYGWEVEKRAGREIGVDCE